MRRLTFLLVLIFSLPAFSQPKHPFTFEDMMKLKRVGEPVPSPDGKWVLFAAVDVDLAANKKTSHIWIVPLNTNSGATGASPVQQAPGEPASERILIPDQDGDRPRWALDGKRFAFLSTKEGGSQVWIADFDSSAGTVTSVHKLTSIATEAGGELWSPDGKNILFTSDVYPECDGQALAEETCNAKNLEDHENSKIKALIFDHLLYRHWNAYKEGKRTHVFVMPAPSGPPRDVTPFDSDWPSVRVGGGDDFRFTPEGELIVSSKPPQREAWSTNGDLWLIDRDGGPPRNLTPDNPGDDAQPRPSPDGRYLAWISQARDGYEADVWRLKIQDRKTGRSTSVDIDTDDVGSFAWRRDSKGIVASVVQKARHWLYAVSLDGKYRRFTDAPVNGGDFDLAPDGAAVVSPSFPPTTSWCR